MYVLTKVSRVKFAKFSFSKVVCSDSSQVWGRAGYCNALRQGTGGSVPAPSVRDRRALVCPPELHCSMKNPFLCFKSELTLLIYI